MKKQWLQSQQMGLNLHAKSVMTTEKILYRLKHAGQQVFTN